MLVLSKRAKEPLPFLLAQIYCLLNPRPPANTLITKAVKSGTRILKHVTEPIRHDYADNGKERTFIPLEVRIFTRLPRKTCTVFEFWIILLSSLSHCDYISNLLSSASFYKEIDKATKRASRASNSKRRN